MLCCTWGPEGGGDLSTGTAGMSCSLDLVATPMDVLGGVLWTVGTSCVVSKGLPIPGIDFFTPFPFLTLELLANLELANSEYLWVDSTFSLLLLVTLNGYHVSFSS